MFLRISRQRLKSGKVIEHYQLAESVWQRQVKKARTSIVYNFGRVDDPAVVGRLRKLAGNILRRCSPDDIVDEMPDWKVVDAWPYGPLHVVQELWRRVGLDKIVKKLTRGRRFGFSVELAVFAMVANRALAPCSKLYCFEQWLREDIRIVWNRKAGASAPVPRHGLSGIREGSHREGGVLQPLCAHEKGPPCAHEKYPPEWMMRMRAGLS